MPRIILTGTLTCATFAEAETVAALLPEHIRLTRAERGCVSFSVTRTDELLVWRVEEVFADARAFRAHQRRTRASVWFRATGHMQRDFRMREAEAPPVTLAGTAPLPGTILLEKMRPVHRPLAAAGWMTGSIAAFSAMAVAGRAVSGLHDTFEIMMWRSLVGLVLVLAVGGAMGRLTEIRADRIGSHFIRNLFHFTGQNLWFWALTMIPLAQVFALEFTSPIWVILLSPLLLGERITRPRALAAGLGFLGILIVARPDFAALDPGVLAAAASAICFATTIILTKALTRGESILSILFWLTLMQLCFGLIAAAHDGRVAVPTPETLPWLALIGLCGVTAHLCLTKALSLASASVVVPIDFARLPVIAVVGMVIYGEALDIYVFFGAAIILLANIINIRAANRAAVQQLADDKIVTPRQ